MNASTLTRHDIDVQDVEYLRHEGKPLLARLYRPKGTGPFPLVIDLHGGAWVNKDRLADAGINEAMARNGIAVAALDFRMPPQAGYPASMADINYAIRWFKSRAAEFGTSPDKVCLMGFSSGAHQAILNVVRPHDARYEALPLEENKAMDATVRCVALCSPLVDPLERYQYIYRLKADGDPTLANRVGPGHDSYWGSEAAMAEGNPTLALERGEAANGSLPPVLYVSLTKDKMHPRVSLERFIKAYGAAGGRVDLQWFEDKVEDGFISGDHTTPVAQAAIAKVIAFIHKEAA